MPMVLYDPKLAQKDKLTVDNKFKKRIKHIDYVSFISGLLVVLFIINSIFRPTQTYNVIMDRLPTLIGLIMVVAGTFGMVLSTFDSKKVKTRYEDKHYPLHTKYYNMVQSIKNNADKIIDVKLYELYSYKTGKHIGYRVEVIDQNIVTNLTTRHNLDIMDTTCISVREYVTPCVTTIDLTSKKIVKYVNTKLERLYV